MHLHHLALGATNVERIAGFYAQVFSLNERSRQSDGKGLRSVWLELDPGILMIERLQGEFRLGRKREYPGVDETDPSEEKQMRAGLFLMAFKVSEGQRKSISERVEESGGSVESCTEFTTYFRDPENNRVAISTHSLHL